MKSVSLPEEEEPPDVRIINDSDNDRSSVTPPLPPPPRPPTMTLPRDKFSRMYHRERHKMSNLFRSEICGTHSSPAFLQREEYCECLKKSPRLLTLLERNRIPLRGSCEHIDQASRARQASQQLECVVEVHEPPDNTNTREQVNLAPPIQPLNRSDSTEKVASQQQIHNSWQSTEPLLQNTTQDVQPDAHLLSTAQCFQPKVHVAQSVRPQQHFHHLIQTEKQQINNFQSADSRNKARQANIYQDNPDLQQSRSLTSLLRPAAIDITQQPLGSASSMGHLPHRSMQSPPSHNLSLPSSPSFPPSGPNRMASPMTRSSTNAIGVQTYLSPMASPALRRYRPATSVQHCFPTAAPRQISTLRLPMRQFAEVPAQSPMNMRHFQLAQRTLLDFSPPTIRLSPPTSPPPPPPRPPNVLITAPTNFIDPGHRKDDFCLCLESAPCCSSTLLENFIFCYFAQFPGFRGMDINTTKTMAKIYYKDQDQLAYAQKCLSSFSKTEDKTHTITQRTNLDNVRGETGAPCKCCCFPIFWKGNQDPENDDF